MTRLETLAIELVRLRELEARIEEARFKRTVFAPTHAEITAGVKRVVDAGRVPLGQEGRKALDAIERGWHGTAPVDKAIMAVGAALNALPPQDVAPDTGRDGDDAATEAP